MPTNRVQFQPGLSVVPGARLWQCSACRYQTSLMEDTVFASAKVLLRTWFLAIFLLTQSKNNISALELKCQLGVCYRTAWLVKHKLMLAMLRREQGRVLAEVVQIDDAFLGGERSGGERSGGERSGGERSGGERSGGKRGRGSENKVPFVAAVLTREGHPLSSPASLRPCLAA